MHQTRLMKTRNTIQLIYSSMVVGVCECLPLGVLQLQYSKAMGSRTMLEQISLVTTWFMLGIKVYCTPVGARPPDLVVPASIQTPIILPVHMSVHVYPHRSRRSASSSASSGIVRSKKRRWRSSRHSHSWYRFRPMSVQRTAERASLGRHRRSVQKLLQMRCPTLLKWRASHRGTKMKLQMECLAELKPDYANLRISGPAADVRSRLMQELLNLLNAWQS